MSVPADPQAAARRVVALFESIAPADVARMGDFYTPDAYFKDPFNEVRGLPAIQRIFTHMFDALLDPRFRVTDCVVQGADCFLAWEFHFAMRSVRRGAPMTIRGGSHLKFDADGRVRWHRDYWDAAEELYEKLPLLGALMRWLKRRAGS